MRNCGVKSPEEFRSVITMILGSKPIDYRGEGSRHQVIEGVYTSTEAPSEYKIPLHHELSCTKNPPRYISFYCEVEPLAETGQTILAKTESVNSAIASIPTLWEAFDGKTLRYISRHPCAGSLFCKINPTHKPWQEMFETNDPLEVERICKEEGFEYEWSSEWIEVRRLIPALRQADEHFPFSYWFNQAHLYHPNPRMHGGYLKDFFVHLIYIDPSTRPYDIAFADGSEIPQEVIYEIYDILDSQTIKFNWKEGDVLILDNFKMMHGRAPYKGKRRILAALTQ